MIVCLENVDYEKHIKIPFGTYVLDKKKPKPTNTNAPRRLDWIYLRVTDNAQGGHELLHLHTNSAITRNHVSPAPIKPTIINQVHSINDKEGIPSGIKTANRTGLVIYDSACISGVDYSEDNDNEHEFENESGNEGDDDTESSYALTEDEYIIDNVYPNEVGDIL